MGSPIEMMAVLLVFVFILALPEMSKAQQTSSASSRPPGAVNYDEAKVPPYTLPDPRRLADGAQVTDTQTWWQRRRPEILRLFEQHVYGKSPGRPPELRFEMKSVDPKALGGKATRKEIRVHFSRQKEGPKMDLLLYLPNGAPKPVPAFLGLNFYGNQRLAGARRPYV